MTVCAVFVPCLRTFKTAKTLNVKSESHSDSYAGTKSNDFITELGVFVKVY